MGIVHHDIKPDNVLVDMKGHCLLADYGGAKFLSDDGTVNLNIEEDVMSTLPYAAPEILSEDCDPDGMKYYDEAVDWWALGATILTLVTGEEYFYGSTIDNLCDNIPRLLEQVRSTLENYHCCPELIDFVESLLQPDPLMRLRGSAVREHEYFDKLPCSWGSLASRSSKVAPPFVISDEDRRQGMTAWPHQFHSLVSGGNQTDIYFVDELHKQGLGLEVDDDFEVPV
ncbi:hypothetical protein EW026_g5271 [Hermanssonia centrifuga]|uniref:non-specific serine/threonine protein kinase n=1 Tax=Hermanssonia centrifuga TaxID=98765 RepID=A0A4S4KEL5_9APHY|nr:hypothetical protein EW026_g5271 [Hermanssonia centrifuga]